MTWPFVGGALLTNYPFPPPPKHPPTLKGLTAEETFPVMRHVKISYYFSAGILEDFNPAEDQYTLQ